MDSHIGNIMTLSNSIIGVSILAMPFCFKQCGVILSILILITSSIVTRLTCHFLLKSAIMARRRTFELLAFHAFGTTGKFMVELGIIGFLMGTCIAFFVIIGDLGPAIIAKMMGTKPTDTLRTSILIGVALFFVLPLGLLKNVDSLHSVSTATIGFYFCLVLKTFSESASHFISGHWLTNVEMWRPVGVLQCLPIFAMALSCQTQLFEIYETLANATLDKMNYIVRVAVNICVVVYICVGFFGYAAFASQPFTGNILMSFSQSPVTDVMKIGFVLSVAFSFPLVIFPCRASLYSLLFKKAYAPYEGTSNYIPESKFKLLTVIIVAASLIIGILIPNIEVVLGLLGSTIGIMICMIFPVTCFICISTKNTNERLIAQFLLFIGVIVMVMGTYANLYAMEQINDPIKIEKSLDIKTNILKHVEVENILPIIAKDSNAETKEEIKQELPIIIKNQLEEIRLEPPQPVEPQEESKKIVVIEEAKQKFPDIPKISNPVVKDVSNKNKLNDEILKENKPQVQIVESGTKKADEVDIEAIKKEDTELQEEEKSKQKDKAEDKEKEAELIKTIEEYKQEQKKLMAEQKELIEEQKELIEKRKQTLEELKEKQHIENEAEQEVRRKAASQIIEIAKKAIEKLAPDAIKKTKEDKQETVVKSTNNIKNENEINIADKLENLNEKSSDNLVEKKVLLPNNLLIPFPMAVNKTLNEILYEKNDNNHSTKVKSNLENDVQHNKPISDKLSDMEVTKSNLIPNESMIKEINLTASVNKKIDSIKPILIENKINNDMPVEKPLKEQKETKDDKKFEEKERAAKRDILSNYEATDSILRVKRESDNSLKTELDTENCERQEKSQLPKTESPFIKLMTEMTKTDLKFNSYSNVIDALKTQLNSESIHLKRK